MPGLCASVLTSLCRAGKGRGGQTRRGFPGANRFGKREKHRKYAEQRNSSLSTLLDRSTQARSDAKDIEEGKDPKKGKKK